MQFKARIHDGHLATFPMLLVWTRDAMHGMASQPKAMANAYMKKLFVLPEFVSKMQAYGNHFQCDVGTSKGMVNYDYIVPSILISQGSGNGEVLGQIHYVDILRHIQVTD